ncbi:hypothetical protein PJN23_29210, partial [Mycobacterium kansasii]
MAAVGVGDGCGGPAAVVDHELIGEPTATRSMDTQSADGPRSFVVGRTGLALNTRSRRQRGASR